jgi:hypothetical protein
MMKIMLMSAAAMTLNLDYAQESPFRALASLGW